MDSKTDDIRPSDSHAVLVAEISDLRRKLAQVEQERDNFEEALFQAEHAEVIRLLTTAGCVYCDVRETLTEPSREAFAAWARNHVEHDCKNHPLRKLEAELERLHNQPKSLP